MEGSHGGSQSQHSALVDGISHTKLVLIEMLLSQPKRRNSIPLSLGPLQCGGKHTRGWSLAAVHVCVHVRDFINAGSSSKFIWPCPHVCQTVQANLTERRCRNTNQGSWIRQIPFCCTLQTCIILSIWVNGFPCLPNESVRQIADDATTNETVHCRR